MGRSFRGENDIYASFALRRAPAYRKRFIGALRPSMLSTDNNTLQEKQCSVKMVCKTHYRFSLILDENAAFDLRQWPRYRSVAYR